MWNEIEGTPPDNTLRHCVTASDIAAAADRLAGHAIRTPVMTSRTLDERTGASVFLKCENFQRVGAFKFRGAFNAMSMLAQDSAARARGVLTYSSGNHAQAVARSAAMLGIRATIVMPTNAPRVKLDATRGYLEAAPEGSTVVEYDPQTTKREELARSIAERDGSTIIPPYDHPDVIAGQGTAAWELLEETGPLDELFVCCGGGGLLSGSAIAAKHHAPACHVIGVEPALADDAARSFTDGVLRTTTNPPTIADGARTPYLGRHTFPLVLEHVDRFETVSEDEIRAGVRFAAERLRMVIEPSGVLGLAGLIKAAEHGRLTNGGRIGVIISGGNIDPKILAEILTSAK